MSVTRTIWYLSASLAILSCEAKIGQNIAIPVTPPQLTDGCAGAQCTSPALVRSILVEVDPPADGAIPPQSLVVTISDTGVIGDIFVKPGVNLDGHDIPVNFGDIIVIPLENLNGHSASQAVAKEAFSAKLEGDGFATSLLSGNHYSLGLMPKNMLSDAPAYFSVQIDEDTSTSFSITQSGPKIFGKISAVAAVGFTVQAFQANYPVSNQDVVDTDGSFVVRLSQPLFDVTDTTPIILEITSESGYRLDLPLQIPPNKRSLDLGEVKLGELKGLFKARWSISDSKDEWLKNVRIVVRGQIGNGTVTQELHTDKNGKAETSLYAGHYDVAYLPSTESSAGFMTGELIVSEISAGQKVTTQLPDRVKLKGRLLTSDSQPAVSARIQAIRHDVSEGSELEKYLSSSWPKPEWTTNPNGEWDLGLDPGEYLLKVIPSPGSPIPYFEKLVDIRKEQDLTIVLPPSVEHSGRIALLDVNQPVARAFVRLFSLQTDSDNQPVIRLIGQSYTDDNGQFRTFVARE